MSEHTTQSAAADAAAAPATDEAPLSGWAERLQATPIVDPAERGDGGGLEDGPEIPDDVREAARLLPEHWLGVVDPQWDERKEPPSWAVMGQWRTDADGEVVEWAGNEDYRPSPAMRGWEEPEDAVDAAVQLAATGYGPAEDVPRLLASADVSVLVDASGVPVTAAAPDGTAVVPVFTSPAQLAKVGALSYRVVAASELATSLPEGHEMYLNPAGAVAFLVDQKSFLDTVRSKEQERPATESAAPTA